MYESHRNSSSTDRSRDRTRSFGRTYFDWVSTLWHTPDKFTLYHQSLDSYLYLRFLRTLIFICGIGCLLTWPVLLPINANGGGTATELDRITIGNVSNKGKLYAHALIAWVFFAFVMFTVGRERLWLIGLRQAWNSSEANAERLASRTVLFLSASKDCLDERNLQRYFGDAAVRIWPVMDTGRLQSLVSSRDSAIEQLESAEMHLIRTINTKARKEGRGSPRQLNDTPSYESLPQNLKKSFRPTHRIKTLPMGHQVDSIDWYRDQIREQEARITEARNSYKVADAEGAAAVFVEFKSLAAAQKAYQHVLSAGPLSFTPRYTGVSPAEVIWENLTIPPARRISNDGIATAAVVATIAFWFLPVAFVGAISNVSYLAEHYKWLGFLNRLPDAVIGLLTGLVPPLLTSMLSRYVPNIFRRKSVELLPILLC